VNIEKSKQLRSSRAKKNPLLQSLSQSSWEVDQKLLVMGSKISSQLVIIRDPKSYKDAERVKE